jgi:hypothetical protein
MKRPLVVVSMWRLWLSNWLGDYLLVNDSSAPNNRGFQIDGNGIEIMKSSDDDVSARGN